MSQRPPCLCTHDSAVRCDSTRCDKVDIGQAFDPAKHCRPCFLFFHAEAYNRAWGGDGKVTHAPGLPIATPKLQRTKLPCIHLGEPTGATVFCPTCPNGTHGHDVPLLACAHYGTTTGKRGAKGHRSCHNCEGYQSYPTVVPEAAEVRNLLFHLYPLSGDTWRWHAAQLRQHAGVFNGKKILALVLDSRTESETVVRAAFAGIFDEILAFPNDPALREVVTFEPLFERVKSLDPSHATLYAHGKGVTRAGTPMDTVTRRWAEVLYETCMGAWERARELLRVHPLAGPFVKISQGWAPNETLSDWHFSGSWFWFRNRDVFSRADWKRIDRFYSGIEAWPSLHFAAEEAGRLFYEGRVPDVNLYSADVWRTTIEPALADWRNERRNLPGLSVEIGGGEHARGGDWIDVDRKTGFDLETDSLPFDDDTVARVYSSHCFEHIRNLHHLLHEIARMCKVGARVEIRVPHYLSPMAMCHDHKQVIPPEQVKHWTDSAIAYWWTGSKKRLRHVRTQQIPAPSMVDARRLFPNMTDEERMTWVPGAAHEIRFTLEVIPHED